MIGRGVYFEPALMILWGHKAHLISALHNNASIFIYKISTIASGLRVPVAIGDYLILKIIYQTSGIAISVLDKEIISAMKQLAKSNGIALAPEAAATYAAVEILKNDGWIDRDETTLLLATGSGMTTPELWNI